MQTLAGLSRFGSLLSAAWWEAELALSFVQSCSTSAQPWGCSKAGGLVSTWMLTLISTMLSTAEGSEVKLAAGSWDICLYQEYALI